MTDHVYVHMHGWVQSSLVYCLVKLLYNTILSFLNRIIQFVIQISFFCRQWQNLTICLFRLIWKNMFCNERTPKDVLPWGAQLKMRLSRISWLIQVSERRRAKKPGYDFSRQKEIVCTFWKNIFFLIFFQAWRP